MVRSSTRWSTSATSNTGNESGDALRDSKERRMPHVIVKLWPGKSEHQKARLFEDLFWVNRCLQC